MDVLKINDDDDDAVTLRYDDFSEKSKLSNVELGYSTWMGDRDRGSSHSGAS